MKTIEDSLSSYQFLSIEHVNGLIALGGLAVAAFAIFVVFSITKDRSRRD